MQTVQKNVMLSLKQKKDVKALAKGLGVYETTVIQMAIEAFLEVHKDDVKHGYEILKRGERVMKK